MNNVQTIYSLAIRWPAFRCRYAEIKNHRGGCTVHRVKSAITSWLWFQAWLEWSQQKRRSSNIRRQRGNIHGKTYKTTKGHSSKLISVYAAIKAYTSRDVSFTHRNSALYIHNVPDLHQLLACRWTLLWTGRSNVPVRQYSAQALELSPIHLLSVLGARFPLALALPWAR